MKSFIVLALFVAAAVAAPAAPLSPDAAAEIVEFDNDNIGVGGYRYRVRTSNGILSEEDGQLVDVGSEDEGISVRGQFSYVGPDGVNYLVEYVADKNGFRPVGKHLPQNA
ncbi:flexible cuticle protein 12-like [Danaus plexippus]|uniref:flexible cuticle protein 12-like n=1 Tax=Danaus plexippus TaxID=13037 RepID=UPI002AB05F01|nr:flexible cuticle protein 12-like [Danaus plexippus]